MKKQKVFLLFAMFFGALFVFNGQAHAAWSGEPQLIKTTYGTLDTVVADAVVSPSATASTDMTTTIQSALNQCSKVGGTVFLKAGVYKVSRTILVPRGCTLRGDWQNPTSASTLNYGTIIVADVNNFTYDSTVMDQTGLFKLSSSSGLVGVTVYYENQSYTNPKETPWTVYYGNGQNDRVTAAQEAAFDHRRRPMLYTVKNVTILNAFRGIGLSARQTVSVESLMIENVHMSVLREGVVIHNSSDVGTVTGLYIRPDYWANLNKSVIGTDDAKPTSSQVVAASKSMASRGIVFTDAEMHQITNVAINGMSFGIYIPLQGEEAVHERASGGSGVFYNINISNCDYGVYARDGNNFLGVHLGIEIAHSSIAGSVYSIYNGTTTNNGTNKQATIKLRDTVVSGKIGGQSRVLSYENGQYREVPKIGLVPPGLSSNEMLGNIQIWRTTRTTGTAFRALNKGSSVDQIQSALNEVGKAGGGVVYLKPGLYNVTKPIRVPENVELRGASSVATRSAGFPNDDHTVQTTLGSILDIDPTKFPPATVASAIELDGNGAGISGFSITYSKNIEGLMDNNTWTNSAATIGCHSHDGIYATNLMIIGTGVGFGIDTCKYFTISNISSTVFSSAFLIVNSEYGLLKNNLQNPTVQTLNSYWWFYEGFFSNLQYPQIRNLDYFNIVNSKHIEGINNFTFNARTFLAATNSTNLYFVNNGLDGYSGIIPSEPGDRYMYYFGGSGNSAMLVNSYRYNGPQGKSEYIAGGSNNINIYARTWFMGGSSNDSNASTDENDRLGTIFAPATNASIAVVNPTKVTAASLTYKDGNAVATVSNKKGTVYYATSALTAKNYTSGTTTIPKNTALSAGSHVYYYFIPATTVDGTKYYARSGQFTVKVSAKSIASATITVSPTSYVEDGKAKTPTVTVKDGTTTLTNGTHYTLTYANNTKPGTATVTVTGKGNYGGTKTATFTIKAKQISSIAVKTLPTKTSYIQNYETLNLTGGVLTVNYNNGTSTTIAMTNSSVKASGFSNATTGTKTITLTYSGRTTTFNVTVVSKQIKSISVKSRPTKVNYIINYETLDLTGGVINVSYNDNSTSTVSMTDKNVTVTGFSNTSVGEKTLTVTYKNKTTTFKVTIIAKQITKIQVTKNPTQMTYIQNYETLDLTGGILTRTYNDNTTSTISLKNTSVSVTGFDNTKLGTNKLTVTHSGLKTTFNVTIVAPQMTSIKVTKNPTQTKYIQGESLDLTGGVITVTYNDENTSTVSMKNTNVKVTGFSSDTVGEKTLTVAYNGLKTTFKVTVIAKVVTSISVEKMPDQLVYIQNHDELDLTGGTVQLHYNDDDTSTISMKSSKITASGFSNELLGSKQITLKYGSLTTTFNVTVVAKTPVSIEITAVPTKTRYIQNYDSLDLSGGKITVNYDDESSIVKSMKNNAVTTSGFDNTKTGQNTITVRYAEGGNVLTANFTVTIVAKQIISVSVVAPTQTKYVVNADDLDLTGGKIIVKYNNGDESSVALTNSKVNVNGFDKTTVGVQTLTATYNGRSATFEVEVIDKAATGVSVRELPIKTDYVKGEEALSLAGGSVYVSYNDDSKSTLNMTSKRIKSSGFDSSKVGKDTITLTLEDGENSFTTTFEVNIISKQISSISVEPPTKTEYIMNAEQLDLTGGIINITYNDGTQSAVPLTYKSVTTSGFDNSQLGEQEITVTYSGRSDSFMIEIVDKQVDGISVSKMPTKLNYIKGEENLSLTGGELTVSYSDSTESTMSMENPGVTASGFSNSDVGEKTITLEYTGVKTTFKVTITTPQIKEIEVTTDPTKTEYKEDDKKVDPKGGEVTVKYEDGSKTKVPLSDKNVKIGNIKKQDNGKSSASVSYLGHDTQLDVDVANKKVRMIAVSKNPTKMIYVQNYERLDLTNGVLTVFYEDDSSSTVSLTNSEVKVTGFNNTRLGNNVLTIEYGGAKTELTVKIEAMTQYDDDTSKVKHSCECVDGVCYGKEGRTISPSDFQTQCKVAEEGNGAVIWIIIVASVLVIGIVVVAYLVVTGRIGPYANQY